MTNGNILLSYKGDASKDVLSSMLDILESKLKESDVSNKTKKKMYNILVECLQNLYHHTDEPDPTIEIENSSAIFMVSRQTENFKIFTGNYISSNDIEGLKERIEHINSLDLESLKAYHKEILNNGQISSKGGGGLGLIDMRRKSQNKLNFEFHKVDEKTYFFTLEITISTNY